MKSASKYLVYLAILSIFLGIIIKFLSIDFSQMGISTVYPVRPISFLNFSNTLLFLAIAFILLNKQNKE